jgi:hypothetical protein
LELNPDCLSSRTDRTLSSLASGFAGPGRNVYNVQPILSVRRNSLLGVESEAHGLNPTSHGVMGETKVAPLSHDADELWKDEYPSVVATSTVVSSSHWTVLPDADGGDGYDMYTDDDGPDGGSSTDSDDEMGDAGQGPSSIGEDSSTCIICLWQGCGMAVERTSPAIRAHLRTHSLPSSARPSKTHCLWGGCSITLRSDNLHRHIKNKHFKLEHVCGTCGRSYSYPFALKRHVAMKHPSQAISPRLVYLCEGCGCKFFCARNLEDHRCNSLSNNGLL